MSFSDLINAAHDKAVADALKPVQDALDKARKDLATAQAGHEQAVATSARRITELEADKNAAQARVGLLEAEVAALKAQIPAPPAYVRPEGADIVKYETLTQKSSVQATAAQVGQKQVSFPAGVFEAVDFGDATGQYGFLFYDQTGVRGSGVDKTTFRLKENTSTKKSAVPAHNPPASNGKSVLLFLLRHGGAKSVVTGFTVEGTEQGHIYSGLQWFRATDGRLEDVKVKGVPGIASREPGETFPVNIYDCARSTVRRLEVDGRNVAGVPVAASGIAVNKGADLTLEDAYAHHIAHAHGFALWKAANLMFVRPRAHDVALYPMNFENVTGAIRIDRPDLTPSKLGYHVAIAANEGSATYTISDPVGLTGKFHVIVTGYEGRPRTQSLDTIKLYVAGVERPDLLNVVAK